MTKYNDEQGQTKKPSKGLRLFYNLTHYDSYHAYRQRIYWIRGMLWLALILYLSKGIFVDYQVGYVINDTIIFLLGMYIIFYYTINAKASIMFRDSASVMRKIAFSGVISNSWNIYDGILKDRDNGAESVEISFFKEKTWITNVLDLIRHKDITLPLTKDDLTNLKDYIGILNNVETPEGKKFRAYATLSNDMVEQLNQAGIELTRLDNRYRTKPFRFDYARATGQWKNSLLGYPTNWSAYLLKYQLTTESHDQQQQRNLSPDQQYIQLKK